MDIGTILYERRNAKGLSQEELAFKVGVSRQSIYKWENNISIPNIYNFMELMRVLKIDLYVINNDIKIVFK